MEKVTDGLYQVGKGYQAFIIDGDEGVTLIDAGLPNKTEHILDGLTAIGRTLDDVEHVVITHAHIDHIGGLGVVASGSNADVMCSNEDAPAVRGEEALSPPPVMVRFPFLKILLKMFPAAEPVDVDRLVAGGDTLSLSGDLTVLATPGHTPGHLSFLLDRSGGVMIVGDAASVNKKGKVVRGFFNAPTPQIDASIKAIATHDFAMAVFGHAPPLRTGASGAFSEAAEKL
jgi:glyoxylase-like metal-dependent hydrolase (beta-lactamase superfamily II)